MTETATRTLPSLYRDPVPLRSDQHAGWQLQQADLAFAKDCNAVPVVLEEFAIVGANYPILFAGDALTPVAALGLRGANCFVQDGRWAEGCYVPAYVRRYPFVLIELDATEEGGAQSLLAIDQAAPHLAQQAVEGGTALFDEGTPAQSLRNAMAFCEQLSIGHAATLDFVNALRAHELLVPRHAELRLEDGSTCNLHGFQVIDAQRLDALDDAILANWHRRGWLAAAHFHLSSLRQFDTLLRLETAQAS